MIVKQILLVSTKGNVQRKVCRRRILMSGCKALTINLQIRYLQLLNFYRKWRFPDVAQTQWRGVVTCDVISKKATVFISFQISLRPLRVYTYFNCVGVGVLFKYWYSCFRHRGSFGIFSVNFNSFVKELILWINKTPNYWQLHE